MVEIKVDTVLIEMVSKYLMSQDQIPIRDYLHADNLIYTELAATTDYLPWDCFVEGRIAVK